MQFLMQDIFRKRMLAELFESGIPFMTRLAPNKTVFKEAAAGNMDDLMSQKYAPAKLWRAACVHQEGSSQCMQS